LTIAALHDPRRGTSLPSRERGIIDFADSALPYHACACIDGFALRALMGSRATNTECRCEFRNIFRKVRISQAIFARHCVINIEARLDDAPTRLVSPVRARSRFFLNAATAELQLGAALREIESRSACVHV
jgi:hypothetical protein